MKQIQTHPTRSSLCFTLKHTHTQTHTLGTINRRWYHFCVEQRRNLKPLSQRAKIEAKKVNTINDKWLVQYVEWHKKYSNLRPQWTVFIEHHFTCVDWRAKWTNGRASKTSKLALLHKKCFAHRLASADRYKVQLFFAWLNH